MEAICPVRRRPAACRAAAAGRTGPGDVPRTSKSPYAPEACHASCTKLQPEPIDPRNPSTRRGACAAEPLEGRLLFSTYTVTTLGDAAGSVTPTGTGTFNATTLRAAMNASNAHAGSDTIKFAPAVVGTITLGEALPDIDNALVVTGPGSSKLGVARDASAATDFSIFRVDAGKTVSHERAEDRRRNGRLRSARDEPEPASTTAAA